MMPCYWVVAGLCTSLTTLKQVAETNLVIEQKEVIYAFFFLKYNLHQTTRTNNDENSRFYRLPVGIEEPKECAGGAIVDN